LFGDNPAQGAFSAVGSAVIHLLDRWSERAALIGSFMLIPKRMPPWSDILKRIFLDHEQLMLGWLLGLLSPAVIEEIRKRRRLRLLEQAMAQELHEVQYMMALKAFVIRQRSAMLDDEFLSWFEQIAASYTGPEPSKQFISMAQALKTLPANRRGAFDPKKGLTLTDGYAPLLSIHINEIALFPIASQKLLLNVSKEIGFYNQQVAYLRRLFDKTFDDLTEINRKNIQQNLEDGYQFSAQRAVRIADAIKGVPPSLKIGKS
jgi:hypothetical protein